MSKTWLNEVSMMRPVLLVLLVTYHAFAPYCGAWIMPDGIDEVVAYEWFALLAYAFMLEGFVFISGYIFAFQILEKHKFKTFSSLLRNKFQRLIIPGMIFSFLYLCLFKGEEQPYWKVVYDIILGIGHLWYLPCLFWCFMIQYVLITENFSPKLVGFVLIVLCFFSFVPFPFRLNKVCYYMIFFYGGGISYKHNDAIKKYATRKNIAMAWVLFLLLFVILNLFIKTNQDIVQHSDSFIVRNALCGTNSLLKALLGWSGIITLYLSSTLYCMKHRISTIIIKIGSCGYGVYVIHQFILVYLYRYTSFPQLTGTLLMPWGGLFITIFASVLLTMCIRQFDFGKKYL